MIESLTHGAVAEWLLLRKALWPHCPDAEHLADIELQLSDPARFTQYIAYSRDRIPAGFAEAAIRRDHVNGARTSPVVFLEGIYVDPAARRTGIARALVEHVSQWARSHGIYEFASDALLDNGISHAVHRALGFQETERVVFFQMDLGEPDA